MVCRARSAARSVNAGVRQILKQAAILNLLPPLLAMQALLGRRILLCILTVFRPPGGRPRPKPLKKPQSGYPVAAFALLQEAVQLSAAGYCRVPAAAP